VAAETVLIGPFTGGLNSFSDPSAVADNELVEVSNMELDLDGSLVSRPPFVDLNVSFPLGATGNLEILGYYYATNGVSYLLASDGLTSTYYFTGNTWVLLTNTIAAAGVTQYLDLAWLVAPESSANPGGSWSPSTGFVAVPAMPKGDFIFTHKNRLWVGKGKNATVDSTRLFLSNVAAPTVWPGNFLSIGPGDGQPIVYVMTYFNDLLVFKSNSIYRFSYTSDPSVGEPSRLTPDIGLADKSCVVTSDNLVFFMYDDKVYQIANFQISQINEKVPLMATTTANIYKPFALSVLNRRIIVSYYDTMYIYSLRTKTWSTWISTTHGPIGRIVALKTNSVNEEAIAHRSTATPTGGARTAKTLKITDAVLAGMREPMICHVRTKNYNYQASANYKRLFWWGVDALFRNKVTGTVVPITFNYSVTWGALRTKPATWGQSLNFKWGQPLTGGLSETTALDTAGSGPTRKFAKFRKGLRFRQAYFTVDFETDGASDTSPVRLFGLTTKVSTKEDVVKSVS